jgi:16S rRNA (uracil1498-N3)-methyltransferase
VTRELGYAAAAPAAAHVFVDDLDSDGDIWIEGEDGHHLQRARRLRVGEAVTASDGRGAWRRCAIAETGEGRLRLAPAGPLTDEPVLAPRIVIAFAPAKGDQAGAVVHQLVELGVDSVMPVTLRRSVVRWDGARAEKTAVRLRRIIREAAMQSRRARLPELLEQLPLSELARRPGLLVAGPGEDAAPPRAPADGEWIALIGPEGGLDPAELEQLEGRPRFSVGPFVLRAVTAPVAVTAALTGFRQRLASDAPDSPDLSNSADS